MKPSLAAIALALVLAVSGGCVTINIYFPAAAAEKAADRIIEEVWQLKKDPATSAPPSNPMPQDAAPKTR